MLKLQANGRRLHLRAFCVVILISITLCASARGLAQAGAAQQDYEAERTRALQLMDQSKFTEALPILEKLVVQKPSDGMVNYALGFAVFANAQNIKDTAARKAARARARTYFARAKELGVSDDLLESMLKSIPPDGGEESLFSKNSEADAAMREGEAAFSHGEFEKAVAAYQRALQLDPKLYEAALFAGDMYFKKGFAMSEGPARSEQMDKAGEWFARAVAIDADRETAYRYWGDALLSVQKTNEARAKFIEAIIAEPYKQLVYNGISKWARQTNASLGHPQIPDDVAEKAGKQQTLREAALVLRTAAEGASRDLKSGKVKTLDEPYANLVKLNDAGMLEAYVLFAHPNQGIASDYSAYRQTNRDKLRRYWTEFVIK